MAKHVSDEEFEQLEATKRHEELVSVLRAIAQQDNSQLKEILARQNEIHQALLRKDFSGSVSELKPLIKELTASVKELKAALNHKPKPSGFSIQRGQTGLIERVIPDGR